MSPRKFGRTAISSVPSRCRPETAPMELVEDIVRLMNRSCSSSDPVPHTPRRGNILLHHVPVHTRLLLRCGSSRDSPPHCQSFRSGIAQEHPLSMHSSLRNSSLSPKVGAKMTRRSLIRPGTRWSGAHGAQIPTSQYPSQEVRLSYFITPGKRHMTASHSDPSLSSPNSSRMAFTIVQ